MSTETKIEANTEFGDAIENILRSDYKEYSDTQRYHITGYADALSTEFGEMRPPPRHIFVFVTDTETNERHLATIFSPGA